MVKRHENIPHEEVFNRWMEDPEFRAEYEALEDEYEEIVCQIDEETDSARTES